MLYIVTHVTGIYSYLNIYTQFWVTNF